MTTAKAPAPPLATSYGQWQGPCWAQPKLDGVRCLATRAGLWSRQGVPITNLPHIEAALAPVFRRARHLILDGELVGPGGFEETRLAVQADQGADSLQLMLFDCAGWDSQEDRKNELQRAAGEFTGPAFDLLAFTWCETEADLDTHYHACVQAGYEGQMVRRDGFWGSGGRVGWLQKRKPFQDGEFTVAAIGSNAITCRHPDGRTFGATVSRRIVAAPSDIVTVRHHGLTSTGLPRNATVTASHGAARVL
jgi:DNA ligase 1